MRRILTIVGIVVATCACLVACTRKEKTVYHVDYHGQEDFFDGAKSSYEEGEHVRLTYGLIATDTDYSFYVDGESYNAKWEDRFGYILEFDMPDHDIEVYCTSRNSMENENPVKYLVTEEKYAAPEGEFSMHATSFSFNELEVKITNKTTESMSYIKEFHLLQKVDGEYVEMELDEDWTWENLMRLVEPGEEVVEEFDLSCYGTIEPGEYRLCVLENLSTDFTISDIWED